MSISYQIMQFVPSLILAIAIGLGVYLTREYSAANDGMLATEEDRRRGRQKALFLRLFGGVIISLGAVISTLPLGKGRQRLSKKLAQAGRPGGLSADEFQGARMVSLGCFFVLGLLVDWLAYTTPIMMLGAFPLGLIYPDLWLNGKLAKRQRQIFRDLPDFLDSLRLAVDAGMDLSSALKVVVEQGKKGPLLDEIEKVEREIALGRTRKEAFKNFSDRLQMTEISSFVLALIQADQLGASIGPVLKIQADVARTRRWQAAETLVNKMPMKMLGPLVVFIFPASFIILFTPLIIQWLQTK